MRVFIKSHNLFVGCLLCLATCQGQATPLSASDVNQFKAQQAVDTARYAPAIAVLAATAQQRAQAPSVQAALQQLKVRDVTVTGSQAMPSPSSSTTGHVLIFISSQMPMPSVVQWVQQADALGATVMLRGLVQNDMTQTRAWVSQVLQQTQQVGGFAIDPIAFERFHITQVPTVVVISAGAPCSAKPLCSETEFDHVSGNMRLTSALERIADQGTAAPTVARTFLKNAQVSV